MKKFICLIIAVIALFTMVLTGCGESTDDPANTPKATSQPTPTKDSSIIIATQAPTQGPTAEPTPEVQYDDILALSEHKYFFASSMEARGTPSELGPQYTFDDDMSTRWSSVWEDVEGAWICVQFGYPVIIHGIEMYENQTWGQMLDWEAQYYSEEQGKWVTVYQETGSYEGEYYEFAQDTEPTYAFRLYFLGGTGITITINEVYMDGFMVDVPEGTAPRDPMDMTDPVTGIPENAQKLSGDWLYSASTSEMSDGVVVLPPEYAFDGDSTTRWSSAFHDLPAGCWIAVDFQAETTISGFVFNEVKDWGHVTEYAVQIMENGEWKTIYEGEEFSSTEYVGFSQAVTTTQLRFLFTDGETVSETVSIWEIDLYN